MYFAKMAAGTRVVAAPSAPQKPVAQAVRAGGSHGAASTEWVENANQEPKWGYAFKCPDCGFGYPNLDPKFSAKLQAAFAKERGVNIARHKRMCALRRKGNGGPVDINAARRAYYGK